MKRFLPVILIFVVALSAAVSAANPASWWNVWGMFFTNASTGAVETVTSANPLPVTVISGGTGASSVAVTNLASSASGLTVSLGSQVSSVAPKGATSIVGGVISVTTSPASWTLTASATDFVLQNLGATTVWIDYNSGGATVSAGMPLTATGTMHDMIGRDAAQGVVIWLVASETVSIYRAEGRR